jgi:hypothetical protein
MWVDALVIVATPGKTPFDRRVLDAAMERRGWEKSGSEGYSASFLNPESDSAVVQVVEQDVKQAVYVAGVEDFEAVCLLSDAFALEQPDGQLDRQDSDLNLGKH